MTKRKETNFGEVIRNRRHEMDMTQQEVAQRIKTSTPYVGHLEAGKRHPSDKVLDRLAVVLGLDRRELYFLANPHAVELLRPREVKSRKTPWEEFSQDERIRRSYNIRTDEMEMLSKIASMGEFASSREFIYILHTIRHALHR